MPAVPRPLAVCEPLLRISYLLTVLTLGLLCAAGEPLPLLGVEGELATRLRGPARLCRDNGASDVRCVELFGERALAAMRVRVPRTGRYTIWARARSATGEPAALSCRADGSRLNAAVPGGEWAWSRIGDVALARGSSEVRFTATGCVRLDQVALAVDPAFTPQGAVDAESASAMARREIYFSDDFMRTKRESGAWQTPQGKWAITELHKRERFDATRSANAFSYLGTGSPAEPAVAVTGYPFWRNYSIEAAVRSLGGGAFGLVACRQDARNYYLFRCHPATGRAELLRCLDGVVDHLDACEGQLRVDDWYLFRLDAADGEIRASIDGHVVLQAVDHTFLDGLAGLWSADAKGAYFDDVLVRTYDTLVERFHDPALDGWTAAGRATARDGELTGPGSVLSAASYSDFTLQTTPRHTAGDASLVFDWHDGANYAFLALKPGTRRLELGQVTDGKSATIAAAPLPPANGPLPTLRLTQHAGRVRVDLGDATVLAALRPQAQTGRVGIVMANGSRFGLLRLERAQRAAPDRVHNRIFAGEDTMVAWASAGSDWQIATAGGQTTAWHEIEHWGDSTVSYELNAPGTLPGKLGLVVRADGQKPETGYQLVAEPQQGKAPRLTLLAGAKPVATATAPADVQTIGLRWIADCAVALADGKTLLCHRASAPPAGHRAGIWAAGWTPAFAQTTVRSTHLVNDYFEAAPVEWRAESGTWEMQNRWTCSPQWSWLGGNSSEAAMLWNKRRFEGDITLHCFSSFQMRQHGSRIYRPKDLCLTICADGHNVASGYTFIYGGWNNTATVLLRREQKVATTTKEALRPPSLLDTTPDMNHLHRKWWHLAVEKHGATIRCYVDDQLALEYTDPEPLPDGQVCYWTHNNATMMARVWIASERPGRLEHPLQPRHETPRPSAPPAPTVVASHPMIRHDFEAGLGTWAEVAGNVPVRLATHDDGLALAVTNPTAGGRFRLKFPLEPFDAMTMPRLSFDYRMPPQARVNLHLKSQGRIHAIVLTNPEARVAGVPIIGQADATADGAWHTADVDLRAMLLRCYPAATALPVEGIALSTLDRANYLTAGIGGNYAGTTYLLDNVRQWTPGPPDLELKWDPEAVVSCTLDREPATTPDRHVTETGGLRQQTALADGPWHFHIASRRAGGAWSRVAHIPIVVDATPPRVVASHPAPASRSSASKVVLDFADASGTDPRTLKIHFHGQDYTVQVVPSYPAASFTAQPAAFDLVTQKLTFDLSMLPMAFDDGEELKLTVAAASDFRGQAMAPYTLAWTYDRSSDKEPPRLVRLEASRDDLCHDDFETGLGEWAPSPEYAIIERDDSTAATGRYSLRIHNPHAGGAFTVTARSTAFDAGHYPLVSFDYKIPTNLRADIVLAIGGVRYTVRFTDPYGSNCIGAVPGVQVDNKWHHTEFNLHEMLTARLPQAPSYVVSSLQFSDTGFNGNNDGVEYHIDNFRIEPASSTRAAPLEWKLTAADPSGVDLYQASLATLPAAVRWTDSKTPAWQFSNVGAGIFHFLVRARDRAGNWSEPLRRKILIDDEPPKIGSATPKAGSRAADGIVRIQLADSPSGINRNKTTLTIGGAAYRANDEGVVYDARTHTLTWNATQLAKPAVFPNGANIPVVIQTEDNVGNASTHKWSWKMDYALDKTPPAAPYVARVPAAPLTRSTFEADTGTWKEYGSYATIARVASTAATGRYSLCITAARARRYFGAYAYRASYDPTKHPIISFDYNMPAGLPMNLHVHNGSSWRTIKLTSPSTYYTTIGSVPLVADGTWRHAEIDLMRFYKTKTSTKTRIRYILFADFATRSAKPGVKFHIDNFAISARENGQNVQFEWNATVDPTGIPGYAYALDKAPTTSPAKLLGTAATATLKGIAPGNWFFHLRARDGAGNWSAPTHYPITIPPPAPPKK